jgi:hypothetical protein
MVRTSRKRHTKRSRRGSNSKKTLRRRTKRQRGGSGDLPNDLATVVVAPPGGDANSGSPDAVATPQSMEVYEENSSADPD